METENKVQRSEGVCERQRLFNLVRGLRGKNTDETRLESLQDIGGSEIAP